MKEVKKHIQNWKDIRIADIPKLSEIVPPIKNLKINMKNYFMENQQ